MVTLTDLPFRGIADPPAQWKYDTPFDPLVPTLTMRQDPGVSTQAWAEQMEDVRRGVEHAEVSSVKPQVYGLEAALSISHDLIARDGIQINMVTDSSGQGFPLIDLGQLNLVFSAARSTAHDHIHSNYKQMFGLEDLTAPIIYEKCQLHLVVVGDSRACNEGPPPGLLGIHAVIAEVPTALRSPTVKGVPENELSHTLVGFFTERPRDAVIQHISIEDTGLTMWPTRLIETYSTVIKHLELRNCQTLPLGWVRVSQDICYSPTVAQVSIVDCKVFDLKLVGRTYVGPDFPADGPITLAPFDEMGATRWVSNADIRKRLMQIKDRIIQRWAPPTSIDEAVRVAQLRSKYLADLSGSTR